MIYFFQTNKNTMIAVKTKGKVKPEDNTKLEWLFSGKNLNKEIINGAFVGPRKEMVSPWSTNAVEISQNMGINNIIRIEEYQIKSTQSLPEEQFDAIVLAVAHEEFKSLDYQKLRKSNSVIYDVKSILAKGIADKTL